MYDRKNAEDEPDEPNGRTRRRERRGRRRRARDERSANRKCANGLCGGELVPIEDPALDVYKCERCGARAIDVSDPEVSAP